MARRQRRISRSSSRKKRVVGHRRKRTAPRRRKSPGRQPSPLRRPSGHARRLRRALARPARVREPLPLEQAELFGAGPVKPARQVKPAKHVRLTAHDLEIRAIRARRLINHRREKFQSVARRVRARKRDKPVIFVLANDQFRRVGKRRVLVARAGTRVDRSDRRKVYAFRKTRPSKKHPAGRLVPYFDWKETKMRRALALAQRQLPPKAVSIGSIDPQSFHSKQAEKFFYEGRKRAGRQLSIKARGAGALDFLNNVVPKVSERLKTEADRFASRRHFALDCSALVKLPSGRARAVNFTADFKQADLQQFLDLGFYEPFVSRKLYAQLAEQLKGEGLVTTGSAQYIAQLPINRGLSRKHWKDARGFAWKHGQGWKLHEARLVRFDAVPNLVMVGKMQG